MVSWRQFTTTTRGGRIDLHVLYIRGGCRPNKVRVTATNNEEKEETGSKDANALVLHQKQSRDLLIKVV